MTFFNQDGGKIARRWQDAVPACLDRKAWSARGQSVTRYGDPISGRESDGTGGARPSVQRSRGRSWWPARQLCAGFRRACTGLREHSAGQPRGPGCRASPVDRVAARAAGSSARCRCALRRDRVQLLRSGGFFSMPHPLYQRKVRRRPADRSGRMGARSIRPSAAAFSPSRLISFRTLGP